ncbi:hypothetical protein K3217_03275 [bacterium BD-1]|nr:hypothetical protein [Ottowia caeni]
MFFRAPLQSDWGPARRKAIENPSVKDSMFDAGFVPDFMEPEAINMRIKSDMTKFKKIAVDAKIEIQ